MNSEAATVKRLFEPQRFAVIGASRDSSKIGYAVVRNLVDSGYKGEIIPVSPKGGDLFGLDIKKSLAEVSGDIDMASICIPAPQVVGAVRECAERGVGFVQIITSGFSEVGNKNDEDEIVRISSRTGLRVLGPNIFGVYSSRSNMNSTFSASYIIPGNVAILTQSGALGIAMIGKTAVDNMGLSAIVSLGNKCDIDEADLLDYLVGDDNTRVIMMYMEGIKNGERLIPVLTRATKFKPVIVIKSGRSKRGALAAASHTGSLAGSDTIFDSIIRQCCALRASTLEEAFGWARFLSACPEPKGNKCVIVTNGGGIGVLATDACEKYNIDLIDDQKSLTEIFGHVTPSFGSTKNPIDITGGARADDYDLALSAPAKYSGIDSTIALYCETATFDYDNLVPMIKETYRKHQEAGKPITYVIVGGESVERAMAKLKQERIPVFGDVEPAVSCMGALYRYRKFKMEKHEPMPQFLFDAGAINEIVKKAVADGRRSLLANEAKVVMQAAGIAMPKGCVARSIDDAVGAAEEIGYPVVMKVVSKDIIHKSDAGGLALNLDNKNDVIDAYEAIMQNCRAYNPEAKIEGMEIAEQVVKGLELVVGAVRDPSFGPVVMVGLGGIYVEVMKDVSFRAYPLSHTEACEMIEEIRSYPLLLGVRGEERKDIEGVIEAVGKIGAVISACPGISDIEINPIVVYEKAKGLRALDVRILIREIKEEAK